MTKDLIRFLQSIELLLFIHFLWHSLKLSAQNNNNNKKKFSFSCRRASCPKFHRNPPKASHCESWRNIQTPAGSYVLFFSFNFLFKKRISSWSHLIQNMSVDQYETYDYAATAHLADGSTPFSARARRERKRICKSLAADTLWPNKFRLSSSSPSSSTLLFPNGIRCEQRAIVTIFYRMKYEFRLRSELLKC